LSFLLDTNVLSEARKSRRDAGVTAWITDTPPELLYISVLTVGEIERSITRLRLRDDHQQVRVFETWLIEVMDVFDGRIAPVTVEIAREWGVQSCRHSLPVPDALIAATAQVHGWTVVTRNVKDFKHTGVRVLNPFTG
jgi:toxin FitB